MHERPVASVTGLAVRVFGGCAKVERTGASLASRARWKG
jgi:hypothetical protein